MAVIPNSGSEFGITNSELSGIVKRKTPKRTEQVRFRIIRLNKAAMARETIMGVLSVLIPGYTMQARITHFKITQTKIIRENRTIMLPAPYLKWTGYGNGMLFVKRLRTVIVLSESMIPLKANPWKGSRVYSRDTD